MAKAHLAARTASSNVKHLFIVAAMLCCAFALAGCSSNAGSAASSSADDSHAVSESTTASAAESTAADSTESTAASSAESQEGEAGEEDASAALQAAMDEARSNGLEVFEGTLRVLTADELIELQEVDPYMPSMEGTFAVLLFDQETEVVGQSGDGSGERTDTATMLGVAQYTEYSSSTVDQGNLDSWRKYDGQHIAIAAYPDEIWFPSDVSLPIGEPRTSEATAL